jgi:hypothetical protein
MPYHPTAVVKSNEAIRSCLINPPEDVPRAIPRGSKSHGAINKILFGLRMPKPAIKVSTIKK